LAAANASLNMVIGYAAASETTSGNQNVALGPSTRAHNTTGSNNIAIGVSAGFNLTTGNNNIDIGSDGNAGESGTIRIGTAGSQARPTWRGLTASGVTGSAVLISSTGQLGVQSSSIRYKEDVRAIDDADDPLIRLRPVQFRYKQAASDGTKPLQYGLIAEEVADIFPELVVRGPDGCMTRCNTTNFRFCFCTSCRSKRG
jgi:hypothetical protein